MNLELKGKHLVITGGSKGIGYAIAGAAAAEGARVTIVARDIAQLEAAASKIAGEINVHASDLASDEGRASLAERVGTPDILVNNAGAIPAGGIRDLSMEDWRNAWELKVYGYIDLCRRIYPDMCARGSGTILNVIGMAGRANRAAYICGSTGNAALMAFTNALGGDAQAHGVRVLGLNPSPTLTDRLESHLKQRAALELGDESRWREMLDPDRYPYGRPASTREVATMALMMMAPAVQYLNGTVIDIDGGGQWADL
jgi:3-oxoacyl-[acyl-carrier protein] reductase